MKRLDSESFSTLIENSSVKSRLKRELKFITSTSHLSDDDWLDLELLPIMNKSGNKGVLVIWIDENYYVLPYEINKLSPSSSTGRASAIICDFCKTWQSGTRAGSILFSVAGTSAKNVGYLCCRDLGCSSHVRTKTSASKISRAQLREDINDEDRIERLNGRLRTLVGSLDVKSVR